MAREKTDFRPQLERLNELFPDKEMLNIEDAMRVYGFKDRRSIRKRIPFTGGFVSKVTLARIMCG